MQDVLPFDLTEIWMLFSTAAVLVPGRVTVLRGWFTDKAQVRVLLFQDLDKRANEAEFAFVTYCNKGDT